MTIEAQQEKLSFQTEVKQLLDIVIHSLYSNKEIFLRELISNASDAIDKLKFAAISTPTLYESDPDLSIRVHYDKELSTLTISDNGIGMSRQEVIDNLGTIAKSGTREFLAQLTGDQKKDAHLIGQFGVGFYSAFIVADGVTVLTRRAGLTHEEGVQWESSGTGEYTVKNCEKMTRGTEVILHLKQEAQEFLDDWRLRTIITKYSDHIHVPILMLKITEDKKRADEWETVNRATALWTLTKNMITEQQYIEFYKHIAHDFEDPLKWAHHKIEGSLEYSCLLYIPRKAPFDLWQQEMRHGLKLYVQRVFIMDEASQFMPHYLRFVRGILDTMVMPLNISRELLQDHPAITKLRSALVRHVLDLLEKMAKEEPEKYAQSWSQFGNVLKEGPAEDFNNRERIAKLLRFATTRSSEQNVSLEDYVERMPLKQKKIYYITAETLTAAQTSPHLEIFRKNNIEVLLLTDRIDEWVVAHLPEFGGKTLQSIAKGNLEMEDIRTKADDQKNEKEPPELSVLIKKMKSVLDDVVKEVRLSQRLTTSPTCLVRDQEALSPHMERLLKAAGQQVEETKLILEINPEHSLIRKLSQETDNNKLNEWTRILYEQALLTEGGTLSDPAAFVNRLNKLWLEAME